MSSSLPTYTLPEDVRQWATSLKGKTVMVTGGAGFIGSHLTQTLLSLGIAVVCVDNFHPYSDPAVKRATVKQFSDTFGSLFTLAEVDITDKVAIQSVFKQHQPIEQVVHLAGLAGVRDSMSNPEAYIDTNINGTQTILDAMRATHVAKIVFASSSSVYGHRIDPPFREDQDISKPVSIYAATKAMGETLLYTYSHLWNIQAVCLRFFTVYGPAQRPDLAIRLFTDHIDQNKPITIFGDGEQSRDFTHISDILQGIVSAMHYQDKPFDIFNLGESNTVSVQVLVDKLEALLGKKAIRHYEPMPPGDVPLTCADISKSAAKLNYVPKVDLQTGLTEFVQWYQQSYASLGH